MGVRREYMFHTRLELASATMIRFGYLYSRTTRKGFVIPHSTLAFVLNGSPIKSSDFL